MIILSLSQMKNLKIGSSFLLPAHGKGGARAITNHNSPSPSEKFLAKPKSRRAKRKGGLGKMNFCPPAVRQRRTGDGERFRNSALAEYQNRKIFVSLIEKIFTRGRLKKCLENFSVLLAVRRAETLGGIIQNPQADFVQRKLEFRPKDTANFHFLSGRGCNQFEPPPK
ncbi:hypothetical protein ES705_13203 [subsurface metagenome]